MSYKVKQEVVKGLHFYTCHTLKHDTTMKCLNEIFLLLNEPNLDHLFRNPETGKLKTNFVFVVDNGPQERPSNALVQMCMVRLLKVLKLNSICQVSFAEYHSKRNFVERVHAEENRALAKHGPFSSSLIHKEFIVGSKEHRENMEAMTDEVARCINTASFARKPLICKRGVRESDYLFNDQDMLTQFLSLSEKNKQEFSATYKMNFSTSIHSALSFWGIDIDYSFEGSYWEDYMYIQNQLEEPTVWKDKYTTTLFSVALPLSNRKQVQPLPDYVRWIKSCELHFMPVDEAELLEPGPWDNIPALFLPSKILDLCFMIMPNPPTDILTQVALLSWTTLDEVKEYHTKVQSQISKTLSNDKERERLKKHPLYENNTKEDLTKILSEFENTLHSYHNQTSISNFNLGT